MLRAFLLLLLLSVSSLTNAAYTQKTIDGVTYGIFTTNPGNVSLHWQNSEGKPYRSLGQLKKSLVAEGKEVLMLMNAGIYSKDKTPAGLWIEQTQQLSPLNRNRGEGNFHIQPNGVFWLKNGRAYINTTAAYAKMKPRAQYAVQSGPMLLIDGQINSRFIKGLSSSYSRNAVCISRSGELMFILTEKREDEWPSFYRLASDLKTLGCYQALYLDGSISSWYIPGVSSSFHWADFVGIIAVTTNK